MDNQTNNPHNEVDLFYIKTKVKGYFTRANDSFFDVIQFVKRNIILLVILLAVGIALGIYQDETTDVYSQKVFVIPNFESVDYLYEEVERIDAKIKEGDYDYLQQIGITNPTDIAKIQIDPVVDIYEFIDETKYDNENDRKFELFKLISENGEMDKMLEDNTTSKNYKNHLITIITVGKKTDKEVIEPFMAHLNSSPYFKEVQKEYKISLEKNIAANDSTVSQINSVINSFSAAKKANNLSYYNDNTPLHEILKFKERLLTEQTQNRVKKINYEKIVKDGGTLLNVKYTKGLNGKMKFVVPFLFLFVFICLYRFRKFYKKQVYKRQA